MVKAVDRVLGYIKRAIARKLDDMRDENVPFFPFTDLDDIIDKAMRSRKEAGREKNGLKEPEMVMLAYLKTINDYSKKVYGATVRAIYQLRRDVESFGFDRGRSIHGCETPYAENAFKMLGGSAVLEYDQLIKDAVNANNAAGYLKNLAQLNLALAEKYGRIGRGEETKRVINCFNQLEKMLTYYSTQRPCCESGAGHVKER